ncbi:hypothetical protein BSQ30_002459 [Escherichia coli]|nr:hypothetical protein [Escherichia coli]EGE5148548.1 hypothetical protein [Escherichia coli]EGE5169212.1 hypothetical protein [Escherichia coli]EGE5179750.1 hypothetical protein [Escherichia coli]EJT1357917.1 hypothetical protein [Escherichia coli]
MTALSFRQVRDRLNLSSDDDLLSLMARVSQWTDSGTTVVIYGPGMYGHEYHSDGVPLSLDGDSDRYISEEVGPLRLRMWVAREDFRCARRTSDTYSSGEYRSEYRSVGWYMDESFGYYVETDSPDTPPRRIRLLAYGEFRIWGVVLTDGLITFRLAPCTWQQPIAMPLYWQVPRPLPDVLANAMRILPAGFHILKELLTSSTSDAKSLHDANTTAAETDTVRLDDMFGEGTGLPKMRCSLAMLVGYVIGQVAAGTVRGEVVGQLPDIYNELNPGGTFRDVVDKWLRAIPPEMQDNAASITGIHAGDWTAYDNAPDSEDGIMGMLWLCLAYLEGLPEAHEAGKKPARTKRSAYRRIEDRHKKSGNFWAGASGTAVGNWFANWSKKQSEQGGMDEPKTELQD